MQLHQAEMQRVEQVMKALWIGLLRSDFTKQIVRSRWHAARIVWMYAILLPAAFALCVSLLIAVLLGSL